MPTLQNLSLETDTDLGWAIATPVRDLAGGVVAVDVICKACKVAYRYSTSAPIFSRFDHLPTCPVFLEVKATTDPWLKRAPTN
jgi:hypothetical protein